MKELLRVKNIRSWFLTRECIFWCYLEVIIPNKKLKEKCINRAFVIGVRAWDSWPEIIS